MTLLEVIEALQTNSREAESLLQTLAGIQKEREALLDLLDNIRIIEYNKSQEGEVSE